MKAVIPAAKKKESLFPFSETRPTGLMPLGSKPLILHTVEKLKSLGVDEIYVVVNYREEMFREPFEERRDVNLIHQEDLTGTAEALRQVDFIEDEFLLVNGDVAVSRDDLGSLVENRKGDLSILATNERKAEKFGVLSIRDDQVVDIHEKPDEPENRLINSGIYAIRPEAMDRILETDESSLTEALKQVLEEIDCRFRLVENYWFDIGSPGKLLRSDVELRNEQEPHIHEDAEVSEKAYVSEEAVVGKGCRIEPGAVIKGKTVLGEDITVGPNTVVENSSIGDGSSLNGCKISEAITFEDVEIENSSTVKDSVIGEQVRIKPGTTIQESFIGPRSFVEMNNSIRGVKFVPEARTDLAEISK